MSTICSWTILNCWPKNLQFTRFLRWNWEISESYLCKRIIRSLRLQRLNNASKYFVSKMVGRNFSGQKRLLKAVTIIWCVFTWIKKTKSSSFQCRAICCPCIGYRPPYYRGLTLPGQVVKSTIMIFWVFLLFFAWFHIVSQMSKTFGGKKDITSSVLVVDRREKKEYLRPRDLPFPPPTLFGTWVLNVA